MRTVGWALLTGTLGAIATACAPAPVAAPPPVYAPKGETKCTVDVGKLEPLVVEWPSAARAELEARLRKGVVPVKFTGCELEVLPRCNASVGYGYTGTTRKRDLVTVRDSSELYARLPRGAARLEAELDRSGELDVSTTVVGRFEAERAAIGADELSGDCSAATHVISAVAVGAFDFYAAGKAKVGAAVGVGNAAVDGSSASEHRSLQIDGDESACAKATRDDKAPPDGCSAVVRIQLAPLGESKKLTPVCPPGSEWDGKACVRREVVTAVECPAGSKWDGKACAALEGPEGRATPDGYHASFKADASDGWVLVDAKGEKKCALPCTYWVTPTAGFKVVRGSTALPLEEFGGLAPGQDAEAEVRSQAIKPGLIWMVDSLALAGGGGLLGAGVVLLATAKPGDDTHTATLLTVGGGALFATGLVILIVRATQSYVVFSAPEKKTGQAPALKWHVTASGIGMSF